MPEIAQIDVYTDGSCLSNPGRGGWAAIILSEGKEYLYSGGFRKTTNNRMEYFAAIQALRQLQNFKGTINIHTDSELLFNTMTKWIFAWQKKGWKKSDGKLILNLDLVKQLFELSIRLKVKWNKVMAHTGDKHNERCDELAKLAASTASDIDIAYENPNAAMPIAMGDNRPAPKSGNLPANNANSLFDAGNYESTPQAVKVHLVENYADELVLEHSDKGYFICVYRKNSDKPISRFSVEDLNTLVSTIQGAING